MKNLICAFLLVVLVGCAYTQTPESAPVNNDVVPVQDPPNPQEDESKLPSKADYGQLLSEYKFLSLNKPRFFPPQPEGLGIAEKKLGTVDGIDYMEMRGVPTDEQWIGMCFNYSGAVYNGHPNVFQWPGALCFFEKDKQKFLVGVRYHKITVTMDLKFDSTTSSEEDLKVEIDGNKVKLTIKDWNPENRVYRKFNVEERTLEIVNNEMEAHLKDRNIYVQSIGTRKDVRLAVILIQRDEQGKILVGGGIFTVEVEHADLAFPDND